MLIRLVTALVLAALVAASAVVFEAASATQRALALVASTRTTASGAVRMQLLAQAEHALTLSWAKPLDWHAGAAEAMSGIDVLRGAEAEGEERDVAWAASADWAARAVSLSPVLPHAWTRLAALALAGETNRVCAPAACLDASYRVSPMLQPVPACERLRLVHAATPLAPDDPRIDAYLHSGASRRAAAQCLDFLAPEDLYQVLMAWPQA